MAVSDRPDPVTLRTRDATFLAAVLDASVQPIVAFDLQGIVLLWNPAAERLFGWTAAEAVGQFAPHVPPEGVPNFVERVSRLSAGEQWIGHRSTRRRKDGSTVELSVSSSGLLDRDGQVVGIVAAITDVTELIRVEQAQANAERLFRAAFENAPNGVMLSDADGAFLDVNRAACEILRRERDELLATTFAAITHHDDLEANLDVRARAIRGKVDAYQFEKRYLAPDGATIWADLSVSVVRDDRDEVQFAIAQIVDIGARRETERELAESAAQIQAVSVVARRLLTADDARQLVCTAVADVTDADIVTLSERRADGSFEITAATRQELVGHVIEQHEKSGAGRALLVGESLFVADAHDSDIVSGRLVERTGARSVLFEPVTGERGIAASLSIIWCHEHLPIEPRTHELVRLLAAEAAHGIERTDLLRLLEEQALTDDLTGLPNRRACDREIEREIARARRGGLVTVAIIDLDWFKRFNDTHGHLEGDRLLRGAANAWRAQLRGGDTLARIGGEEFIVLLPDSPEPAARHILERLQAAMPSGETCSIGFADWDGQETIEQLLARADAALYVAKSEGRNRIVRSD